MIEFEFEEFSLELHRNLFQYMQIKKCPSACIFFCNLSFHSFIHSLQVTKFMIIIEVISGGQQSGGS